MKGPTHHYHYPRKIYPKERSLICVSHATNGYTLDSKEEDDDDIDDDGVDKL